MEASLRAQYPRIDAGTVAELRQEFERVQISYVTDFSKEAPAIYARYFTADELRDMLAFYRTPTGIKMLKVLPKITAEVTGAIIQREEGLQKEAGEAFENILRRRGYIR